MCYKWYKIPTPANFKTPTLPNFSDYCLHSQTPTLPNSSDYCLNSYTPKLLNS